MRTFSAALAAIAFALTAAFPAAAAEKTFRLGMTSLPPSMGNPYSTTSATTFIFWTSMYDQLTIIDNEGNLLPWLATSWEPASETTWVFKLRPGVTFSNGEPFDAAAVKTVFDFLATPAAEGQSVAREASFVAAVNVIDPLTVEIVSDGPNILLPRYLAGISLVAPRQLTEQGLESFVKNPVGTGPFKLENWGPERVTFTAFRDSWRAPKVDRLEILSLPDATTRLQALETGRVDVAMNLSPDHVERLEQMGNRLNTRNAVRILGLSFDSVKEGSPFRDVRVRQAVNYAVNRKAIIDTLLGGLVEQVSQPTPRGAFGYDPSLEPYPYDPDKARALLAEAGYPNGFSFVMEFPAGQLANDEAIMQQVAADLAKVGVRMEIHTIMFAQMVRNMIQGEWKGQAFANDYNPAPSMDALRPIPRHSCAARAPWFCDPAIEPVIAEAFATFDLERRLALTRQVIKYYRDNAASLFLFPTLMMDGLGPRVQVWEPWNDNLRFDLVDVQGGR